MHFKKEHIIKLLNRISIFAAENLEEIKKVVKDNTNKIDSTYAGLIIRQYTIVNDLKILFETKVNGYLTSEFILFRCIVDDYIRFTYVVNQENKEEYVVKMNSDAYNKNFNKFDELAKINEEKFEGKYPFYPTNEFLKETKKTFKDTPENEHYFINKDSFKLKSFPSTGSLIKGLDETEYTHSLIRAYFIWRKYSEFVHYSYFSYAEETLIDPTKDDTYSEYAEIICYSYMNILNSMKHFVDTYNLSIIDSNNLAEYYKDAGH